MTVYNFSDLFIQGHAIESFQIVKKSETQYVTEITTISGKVITSDPQLSLGAMQAQIYSLYGDDVINMPGNWGLSKQFKMKTP